MSRALRLGLVVLLVLLSSAALAHDLAGQDRLLCKAGTVTACTEDGHYIKATPFDFNVPQFVEVDLEPKRISTLGTSGQDRSTDIRHVERTDGYIVLRGAEQGRAFSFVINEPMGLVTVAIAGAGLNRSHEFAPERSLPLSHRHNRNNDSTTRGCIISSSTGTRYAATSHPGRFGGRESG